MTDSFPPSDRRWATPLSWAFGLLWSGIAVIGLFGPGARPSLFVAAYAGLLILPPVVARVRTFVPAYRPFWAPPLIALAVHLIGGGLVNAVVAANRPTAKPTAVAEVVKPTAKDAAADAEAQRIIADYAAKDPGQRFADLIENELLDRVSKVPTVAPTSMPEVWNRLGEIEALAVQVREGRTTAMSPSQKKALAKFERALSAKQATVFPQLRTAYRALSKSTLWEKDISVRGSGRMIEYVGGTFASNANIKAAQEIVGADLKRLRFDRARYRWIPDGEGAQYDLEAPSDREIIY